MKLSQEKKGAPRVHNEHLTTELKSLMPVDCSGGNRWYTKNAAFLDIYHYQGNEKTRMSFPHYLLEDTLHTLRYVNLINCTKHFKLYRSSVKVVTMSSTPHP